MLKLKTWILLKFDNMLLICLPKDMEAIDCTKIFLKPVDNVQVNGMDEVGIVIAFQIAP